MSLYQVSMSLLNNLVGTNIRGVQKNKSFDASSTGVTFLTHARQFLLVLAVLDPSIRTNIYLNLHNGNSDGPQFKNVSMKRALDFDLGALTEHIVCAVCEGPLTDEFIMQNSVVSADHMRTPRFIHIQPSLGDLFTYLFAHRFRNENGRRLHNLGVAEATTDGVEGRDLLHTPD